MFIRSSSSLGLMAFNRPFSILARSGKVPRISIALARLGLHIHTPPTRPFHSSLQQLQESKNEYTPSPQPTKAPTPPPEKPFPQDQTPTDGQMEPFIPGFSKLGVDAKLLQIQLMRSYLATETQKNDPQWRAGAYEAATEGLARKEKEIRDSDTWWKRAFRNIAWGPTIALNVIIALFWG
ncbi:MAG: hypothetical protein ASARMPREDX12_006008 [Alectoria sarmentosa]|nr:MAG: hypothetical protein ASARMPREDX12_006008 [Alectoria sarmentosa]